MPNLEHIRVNIKEGELQLAISQIIDNASKYATRFRNEALLQAASIQQLHSESRKGLLNLSEQRVERSRITDALLELVDDIEQELRRKEIIIDESVQAESMKIPTNTDEETSAPKPSDEEQRRHLQVLRETHLQQLRVLEQQAAKFGLYAPAYITSEIEDRRQQVADIEHKLSITPE